MKFKNFLLLAIMLIAPLMIFAQNGDEMNASTIIESLTPIIVLGVSALVNWMTPKIPGWAMLMIVTAISAGVAWVTGMLLEPEMSWLMQFGYGLLSVFLNQLYKKMTVSTN